MSFWQGTEWLLVVRIVMAIVGILNFAYRETNIKHERNDRYGSWEESETK